MDVVAQMYSSLSTVMIKLAFLLLSSHQRWLRLTSKFVHPRMKRGHQRNSNFIDFSGRNYNHYQSEEYFPEMDGQSFILQDLCEVMHNRMVTLRLKNGICCPNCLIFTLEPNREKCWTLAEPSEPSLCCKSKNWDTFWWNSRVMLENIACILQQN